MVWISDKNKTFGMKILKKTTRMISFIVKLFPIPCRFFSA